MFSRRLQKSKIKELQKEMRESSYADRAHPDARKKFQRTEEEYNKAKKEVFTDERKI